MTARRVLLRLRYRPASDILTGTVDLDGFPVLETIETSLDADTTLHWARLVDPDTSCPDPSDTSDTLEVLSSFHLIHAHALVRSGSLPGLPADVLPHLRAVMQSGMGSLRADASTLERVQARSEASVPLALRQLRRPDEGALYAPPQWSSDPDDRKAASSSLRRLSSALSAPASAPQTWFALRSTPMAPPPPPRPAPDLAGPASTRSARVARLIDELASVLETSDGLGAAGTSAAAAEAASNDPTLSADDREALGQTLRSMANPSTWRRASRDLDRVAEHLVDEDDFLSATTHDPSADHLLVDRSTPFTTHRVTRHCLSCVEQSADHHGPSLGDPPPVPHPLHRRSRP